MKTGRTPGDNQLSRFEEQGEFAGPLPMHHGRRRRPPLEQHGDWDPWLPPKDADADIPVPLRLLAGLVLLLLMFLTLVTLLALLGS